LIDMTQCTRLCW